MFTEKNVEFDKTRVVILPLPYNRTGSYRGGVSDGPGAIFDASQELELYDEETDLTPADIGIFTLSPPELPVAPELMIERVYSIIKGLIKKNKFVVSLDLDVLDSGIMPSVQTPQPGGFSWYGILGFLKTLIREKNVLGFDVVELSPIQGNPAPDFLAAKLVYKIIGYKRFPKKSRNL